CASFCKKNSLYNGVCTVQIGTPGHLKDELHKTGPGGHRELLRADVNPDMDMAGMQPVDHPDINHGDIGPRFTDKQIQEIHSHDPVAKITPAEKDAEISCDKLA